MTEYVWQDTAKYLKRPARRQVDSIPVEERGDDAGEINIWSGRRLRGSGGENKKRERGKCVDGTMCQFLHRLPTAEDLNLHHDQSQDIFGREKVALNEKGRNRGVGSFERESRTLYVQYGGAGHYDVPTLRKLLEADFAEWGAITNINIIPDKTIAFVKYELRASAEFAKEAMHNRGLRGSTLNEVLTVAWANDDPNPTAIWQKTLDAQDAMEDAVFASFDTLPPEAKRTRLAQLDLLVAARQRLTKVATDYPDTDTQYAARPPVTPGDAYPGIDGQYAVEGAAYPNTDGQYIAQAAVSYPSTTSQPEHAAGQEFSTDAQQLQWYQAAEQQPGSGSDDQHQAAGYADGSAHGAEQQYGDGGGQYGGYTDSSGQYHAYTAEEYAAWYYAAAGSWGEVGTAGEAVEPAAATDVPTDAGAPEGPSSGKDASVPPEAGSSALGLLADYGSSSEGED